MKKLALLIIAYGICTGAAGAYPELPPSAVNDIQGLQGIHHHDMQLMQQQIFRKQEIDETQDIQAQKEKKKRELENADIRSDDPALKKILEKRKTKDVNFVEENGEIKIENTTPSEPPENNPQN